MPRQPYKVTEALMWRAKELAGMGVSRPKIADELGLSLSTVKAIVRGDYDLVQWDDMEEGRQLQPCRPLESATCQLCGRRAYLHPGTVMCLACVSRQQGSQRRADYGALEETPSAMGLLGPCLGLDLPDDPETRARYRQARARADARLKKGQLFAPDLYDPDDTDG